MTLSFADNFTAKIRRHCFVWLTLTRAWLRSFFRLLIVDLFEPTALHMVPFIKLRSLPSCCQHHRQSTSNAFINTKKAFKKLSMFYFETFRIILNPSSFWSLLILKLSLFLSLLVVRRFDDDAVQLVFLCRRMWLSPPKPRGDGTCYQQTSISKTVSPNHASWDIDLLDAQQ